MTNVRDSIDRANDREREAGGGISIRDRLSGNDTGGNNQVGISIRDRLAAGDSLSPQQLDEFNQVDGVTIGGSDIGFLAGSFSERNINQQLRAGNISQAQANAIRAAQAANVGHRGQGQARRDSAILSQSSPEARATRIFQQLMKENGGRLPRPDDLVQLVQHLFPTTTATVRWASRTLANPVAALQQIGSGVQPFDSTRDNPEDLGFVDDTGAQFKVVPGAIQGTTSTIIDSAPPGEKTPLELEQTARDAETARIGQLVGLAQPLLQSGALRTPEETLRFLQSINDPATGQRITQADAQAVLETLQSQERNLFETQDIGPLTQRAVQGAFGRGLGTFTPAGQGGIQNAFRRFGDTQDISNFFNNQELGNAFQSFLQGPGPTQSGLSRGLNDIISQVGADLNPETNPLANVFQARFQTPDAALNAGIQPFIQGIAPRLRNRVADTIAGNFGGNFATNPADFQTTDQLLNLVDQVNQIFNNQRSLI